MKGKVYVITHKKVDLKLPDSYTLLQVGKPFTKLEMDCISDDCKENIAKKNNNYCELTGLYWIWKNEINNDYIGLCHYRRFLMNKGKILSKDKIKRFLKKYDVILPKKFYFSDNLWDNYFKNGAGREKDLVLLKQVIINKYPDYEASFNKVFNSYSGSYCNMMIMKKEDFNNYCKWLFDILFQLEKQIDLKDYDKNEARIFGYMSEILLNVWILKNKKKVKYQQSKKMDDKFKDSLKLHFNMLINRTKTKLLRREK